MRHFKSIVVGGGIVGAGIFRDLCLHDVECLLIEKDDFSAQTSQKSSKMLHGGIRYLENLDFKLVFEALYEKNLWLKLTPHLTKEVPLVLPVYKDSLRPLWMIKIGLFLYDFLSNFKNSPHKILNADSTISILKNLNKTGLRGAGIYYDAIMDDAKITLEVIYDALKHEHGHAHSHTEVIEVRVANDLNILKLKNKLNGEIYEVSCNQLVYALGPYTDQFLSKQSLYNWKSILLPSKGSHLWISKKDLPLEYPIVITTKDGRVIFVLPHSDKILVGTTEVETNENLDFLNASEDEIDYLLKALNSYFPELNLGKSNILSTFAGVRPLIKDEGAERGKTSREHKIYQPLSNTYVIAGGKYTTFRVMGQEITREICHKHGKSYNPDLSQNPLAQKSMILPFDWELPNKDIILKICATEYPKTFEDLIVRRLSIPSRKHWEMRCPQYDFNNYFLSLLAELNNFFPITKSDIENFN